MDNMPERRVSSHTEEHAHWKNSWSTLEFPNVVPTYKIVSMLFSSIALRHLICMMIKSSLKKRLTWDENKKKKKRKKERKERFQFFRRICYFLFFRISNSHFRVSQYNNINITITCDIAVVSQITFFLFSAGRTNERYCVNTQKKIRSLSVMIRSHVWR